jgi:YD repeat-containing protein
MEERSIPLGYVYDTRGNVLSYRDVSGYWYVYTRDEDGRAPRKTARTLA